MATAAVLHCTESLAMSNAFVQVAVQSTGKSASKFMVKKGVMPAVSKYYLASRLPNTLCFSKTNNSSVGPQAFSGNLASFKSIPAFHLMQLGYGNHLHQNSNLNQHNQSALYRNNLRAPLTACEEQKVRDLLRKLTDSIKIQDKEFEHSVLDLSPENFDSSPYAFRALGRLLATNSKLRVLRIKGVQLTAEDMELWLQECVSRVHMARIGLDSIIFSDNGIGEDPECIHVIVRLFLMLPRLQFVSLVRNSLNNDHLAAISQLITMHKKIRRLSLCWNGISDVYLLEQALSRLDATSKLAELDLSHNFINEIQAASLEKSSPTVSPKHSISLKKRKVVIDVGDLKVRFLGPGQIMP